jgi:excisionase family DNA binding protein
MHYSIQASSRDPAEAFLCYLQERTFMDSTPCSFEPLMDVQAAAMKLSLHPKTVMRMARESRIPAFHVGRYWLFRASLIDAWLTTRLQSAVANSCA